MADCTVVRMDKWLWSVRLFKTRSLATDACNAGKVKINGTPAKPSRNVKVGEELTVQIEQIRKTIKVLALLDKRVGAPLVAQFMEDLTPKEEYSKIDILIKRPLLVRDRGTGRPSKKDRRDIDKVLL
ncbi:MAG: RNA-binding S4 domain-containing protein [Bacteroidota bacterium]